MNCLKCVRSALYDKNIRWRERDKKEEEVEIQKERKRYKVIRNRYVVVKLLKNEVSSSIFNLTNFSVYLFLMSSLQEVV